MSINLKGEVRWFLEHVRNEAANGVDHFELTFAIQVWEQFFVDFYSLALDESQEMSFINSAVFLFAALALDENIKKGMDAVRDRLRLACDHEYLDDTVKHLLCSYLSLLISKEENFSCNWRYSLL